MTEWKNFLETPVTINDSELGYTVYQRQKLWLASVYGTEFYDFLETSVSGAAFLKFFFPIHSSDVPYPFSWWMSPSDTGMSPGGEEEQTTPAP